MQKFCQGSTTSARVTAFSRPGLRSKTLGILLRQDHLKAVDTRARDSFLPQWSQPVKPFFSGDKIMQPPGVSDREPRSVLSGFIPQTSCSTLGGFLLETSLLRRVLTLPSPPLLGGSAPRRATVGFACARIEEVKGAAALFGAALENPRQTSQTLRSSSVGHEPPSVTDRTTSLPPPIPEPLEPRPNWTPGLPCAQVSPCMRP
jgi:hypothetical protein